jgi:hypothetical protein
MVRRVATVKEVFPMYSLSGWAAGLCLALAVPGLAAADDKPACGNHGTTIDFVDTPKEAAAQAKKAGKLVFVLHVSGHFEDPRFT